MGTVGGLQQSKSRCPGSAAVPLSVSIQVSSRSCCRKQLQILTALCSHELYWPSCFLLMICPLFRLCFRTSEAARHSQEILYRAWVDGECEADNPLHEFWSLRLEGAERGLSAGHTPYTQHVQLMWHSCDLTPPARLRCTGTSSGIQLPAVHPELQQQASQAYYCSISDRISLAEHQDWQASRHCATG